MDVDDDDDLGAGSLAISEIIRARKAAELQGYSGVLLCCIGHDVISLRRTLRVIRGTLHGLPEGAPSYDIADSDSEEEDEEEDAEGEDEDEDGHGGTGDMGRLFEFHVLALSADGSSDNSLVNTVLKDSRDGTSFPHPMDPTIPVAVLGDRNLGRMDVVEGLGLAYKDSIARREAWRASGVGPEPKNLMKTDPLGLMLLLTDLAYLNMVLNPRPRQQYTCHADC